MTESFIQVKTVSKTHHTGVKVVAVEDNTDTELGPRKPHIEMVIVERGLVSESAREASRRSFDYAVQFVDVDRNALLESVEQHRGCVVLCSANHPRIRGILLTSALRGLLTLGPVVSPTVLRALVIDPRVQHFTSESQALTRIAELSHDMVVRSKRYHVSDVVVEIDGYKDHGFWALDVSDDGFSFLVNFRDYAKSPVFIGQDLPGLRLRRGKQVLFECPAPIVRHVSELGERGYRIGCAVQNVRPNRIEGYVTCGSYIQYALRRSGIYFENVDGDKVQFLGQDGDFQAEKNSFRVVSATDGFPEASSTVWKARFEIHGLTYEFYCSQISSKPLELSVPATISLVSGRKQRRQSISGGVDGSFYHPLSNRFFEGRVTDLSSAGASIEVTPKDDTFPKGLVLTKARFHTQTYSWVCDASVRSIEQLLNGNIRLGLEFSNVAHSVKEALSGLAVELRQPMIADGAEQGLPDVVSLFDRAGLWSGASELSLQGKIDHFQQAYGQLTQKAAKNIFRSFVFKSDDVTEGYVSFVRQYPQTWYVQHLASIHKKPAGSISLNTAVGDYFDQFPDVQIARLSFFLKRRWPSRIFGGFARMTAHPERSVLSRYGVFVVNARDMAKAPRNELFECHEATNEELLQIERYFVEKERTLIRQAEQLTRDGFSLSGISKLYEEAGLFRKRKIFVARVADHLIGFAVAEITSPGVNIRDHFNQLKLYAISDQTKTVFPDFKMTLIQYAAPSFIELGLETIRVFEPWDDRQTLQTVLGQEPLAVCDWTFSRDVFRRFCAYMESLHERVRRPRSKLPESAAEEGEDPI